MVVPHDLYFRNQAVDHRKRDPVGYVVSASRIADHRIILAAYRLADLLRRIVEN
jgi:hypothetical protein